MIAKYAAAVEAPDTALAAQVWDNSPDVSLIHPRGHEHGWEAIRKNFFESVMIGMMSERKLAIRDVKTHVSGGFAWAEFYWRFNAKMRANGSPVETEGRETQVYRKDGAGRWKLVHVHYSAMPPAQ